jgi:hypothetical protein
MRFLVERADARPQVGYRAGYLWDRSGRRWRRVADWLEPDEAAKLVRDGATWLVEWCGGGYRPRLTWSDELSPGALAQNVLSEVITTRKAIPLRRKLSVPTVFVAEHWRDDQERSLVLFVESGPYPRAARMFA